MCMFCRSLPEHSREGYMYLLPLTPNTSQQGDLMGQDSHVVLLLCRNTMQRRSLSRWSCLHQWSLPVK